jgi:hypothetical protein
LAPVPEAELSAQALAGPQTIQDYRNLGMKIVEVDAASLPNPNYKYPQIKMIDGQPTWVMAS